MFNARSSAWHFRVLIYTYLNKYDIIITYEKYSLFEEFNYIDLLSFLEIAYPEFNNYHINYVLNEFNINVDNFNNSECKLYSTLILNIDKYFNNDSIINEIKNSKLMIH